MIRRNHIISVLLIKLLTAISRALTGAVFWFYSMTGISSSLRSHVSISHLYPPYFLISWICHHNNLHIPRLLSPSELLFGSVIVCVYPTSLPLPPSYQLDLSSYVSFLTVYPYHLLINLMSSYVSIPPLSPPHQLDL